MAMSKKDYITIAASLADQIVKAREYFNKFPESHTAAGELIGAKDTAYAIARTLAANNPRFDRVRFLAAVGAAQE